MAFLFFAGMGMMMQMAASNTLLQTLTDDDKRGRVMSFYGMAFFGMAPLGSLIAGSLASKIGTPATVVVGGLTCILGALLFIRHLPTFIKSVLPIYARKGIIPEITQGLAAPDGPNLRP